MANDKNYHHDIISHLPDCLKESILICLPLRDAVRTSALSRNWRFAWTRLPHLKLDRTLWPGSFARKDLALCTYLRRILNVLLSHEGPITELTFSCPRLQVCPEIDKILFMLSKRNDIEKLTLNIGSDQYKLHSLFFRFQKVKHVKLYSCSIHPPSGFIGFTQLLTLTMWGVAIGSEQLVGLVARCPLLEKLKLKISHAYETLEIQAPKLKRFIFQSRIKSVSFKNSLLLEEFVIAHYSPPHDTEQEESPSLEKYIFFELISSLPQLRRLCFDSCFMESVTAGGIPTRPSFTLVHLNKLELEHFCLYSYAEISCLLCLIRISPNLRQITMTIWTDDSESALGNPAFKLVGAEEYNDIKLDQLRVVDLACFTGSRNQMELVKFLLIKSPGLKKIELLTDVDILLERRYAILQELTQFHRASPTAEIVYR
ncbi:unnamed protein product [Cuscuta campestris]|uniref:FBD domain-containing protein n=1 Tax=Cuscuta campestris TaxID=132261 RepID=A0A484M9Q2_9ASTE|nr:unnamed protein product [Cuscuta campestris]